MEAAAHTITGENNATFDNVIILETLTLDGSIILGSPLPIAQGGTGQILLGSPGQVLTSTGGLHMAWVTPGSSGIGTVTSVALTTPSLFTVTGSPITTSGTLAISYTSGQSLPLSSGGTNNTTSTPTSGFILTSSGSGNTLWTLPNLASSTGSVPIAQGGTGQTSTGTTGTVLTVSGPGTTSWVSPSVGSVTSITMADVGTFITYSPSTITSSGTFTPTLGTLSLSHGGTGQSSLGTPGYYLTTDGSVGQWVAPGTGITTLTGDPIILTNGLIIPTIFEINLADMTLTSPAAISITSAEITLTGANNINITSPLSVTIEATTFTSTILGTTTITTAAFTLTATAVISLDTTLTMAISSLGAQTISSTTSTSITAPILTLTGATTATLTGATTNIDAAGVVSINSGAATVITSGTNLTLDTPALLELNALNISAVAAAGQEYISTLTTVITAGTTVAINSGAGMTLAATGAILIDAVGAVNITGGADVSIESTLAATIITGGAFTCTVGGAAAINAVGLVALDAGGAVTLTAGAAISLGAAGAIALDAAGACTMNAVGLIAIDAIGACTVTAGGAGTFTAIGILALSSTAGAAELSALDDLTLAAGGIFNLTAGGAGSVYATGILDITSVADLTMNGSAIQLIAAVGIDLSSTAGTLINAGGTVGINSGIGITIGTDLGDITIAAESNVIIHTGTFGGITMDTGSGGYHYTVGGFPYMHITDADTFITSRIGFMNISTQSTSAGDLAINSAKNLNLWANTATGGQVNITGNTTSIHAATGIMTIDSTLATNITGHTSVAITATTGEIGIVSTASNIRITATHDPLSSIIATAGHIYLEGEIEQLLATTGDQYSGTSIYMNPPSFTNSDATVSSISNLSTYYFGGTEIHQAATGSNLTISLGSTVYISGTPTVFGTTWIQDPLALCVSTGTSYFGESIYQLGGVQVNAHPSGQPQQVYGATMLGNQVMIDNQRHFKDNDSPSNNSGSPSQYTCVQINQPTVEALATSVYYSQASTVFIAGNPLPNSSNESLTTSWSLFVYKGASLFGGTMYSVGGTQYDPLNSLAPTTGKLYTNTNQGNQLFIDNQTKYYDGVTANSGTIAEYSTVHISQPTVGSIAGHAITTTNAACIWIDNSPIKDSLSSNTLLNSWAIYIANGASYFGGMIYSPGGNPYNALNPAANLGNSLKLDYNASRPFTNTLSNPLSLFTVAHINPPTGIAQTGGYVITDAASLYINGAPAAATGSITNAWSILVSGGNSKFNGNIISTGTVQAVNFSATGGVTVTPINITSASSPYTAPTTGSLNIVVTGSAAVTIYLPVATSLPLGTTITISNETTGTSGTVTVNKSDTTTLQATLLTGEKTDFILRTVSALGTWKLYSYIPPTGTWDTNNMTQIGTAPITWTISTSTGNSSLTLSPASGTNSSAINLYTGDVTKYWKILTQPVASNASLYIYSQVLGSNAIEISTTGATKINGLITGSAGLSSTTGVFSSTLSSVGLTSTAGITVSGGTSALAALTASTGVFSSTLSSTALTTGAITAGAIGALAITSVGSSSFSVSTSTPAAILTNSGFAITLAPPTLSSSYQLTFPTTAGTAGSYLTSSGGASAMTWTAPPIAPFYAVYEATTSTVAVPTSFAGLSIPFVSPPIQGADPYNGYIYLQNSGTTSCYWITQPGGTYIFNIFLSLWLSTTQTIGTVHISMIVTVHGTTATQKYLTYNLPNYVDSGYYGTEMTWTHTFAPGDYVTFEPACTAGVGLNFNPNPNLLCRLEVIQNVQGGASSGGGSGTVTSVSATVPSIFSITGSPITTTGTLAMSYSGTALPIANGGTGRTTILGSNQLLLSNGSSYVGAAYSTTPSAGAVVAWDSSLNITSNRSISNSLVAGGAAFTYTEGSWTPTLSFSGGSPTPSVQLGSFTQVGKMVTVNFRIAYTVTSPGSDVFQINNLPFTISGTNSSNPVFMLDNYSAVVPSVGSNAYPPWMYGYGINGTTTVYFYLQQIISTAQSNRVTLSPTVTNTVTLAGTFTFIST